jgi:hypothetical protein
MNAKQYPQLGACGIVCALCPRFHTNGPSRCTGCGAEGFRDVHPACKIHTCAAVKKGLETCADCMDFPCAKIAPWDGSDSFVTHRNCLQNLRRVQTEGYEALLSEINRRSDALERLLQRHDDGRSKGFYCLACALLPASDLEICVTAADAKQLNPPAIRQTMLEIAEANGLTLTLRKE